MAIMLAVCLVIGFIFTANACQSVSGLYHEPRNFAYEETDGEVKLTLTNGGVVRMQFGDSAVKVYDAHRHKSAVYEIAAFICAYGKGKGYTVSRKRKEIVGELKLHNLLYMIGYKRGRTKDADVDYTADSRWYVNLASAVLG